MGMGPEEALMAITAMSAYSLRRNDIGRIAPGCLADLVVLEAETALDLGYHASVNLAALVIKRGHVH
jgi:imidazolonepropionase